MENLGKEKKEFDPLVVTRSPFLFGGVINEWKKRFPYYLSDFKDGLDAQVIATASFIFFACLSGAIGKRIFLFENFTTGWNLPKRNFAQF